MTDIIQMTVLYSAMTVESNYVRLKTPLRLPKTALRSAKLLLMHGMIIQIQMY